MRSCKWSVAVALFCCLGDALAWAQCPTSHLTPLVSYGRDAGPDSVTGRQVDGDGEEYALQAVEYSSQRPYTVSILERTNGEFRVVVVQPRNEEPGVGPSDLVVKYRVLNRRVAQRAVELSRAVLLDTRYPSAPCEALYLDGFYMQFIMNSGRGHGSLAGEVYSPDEGTAAHALVELARSLREYAVSDASEARVKAALRALDGHR